MIIKAPGTESLIKKLKYKKATEAMKGKHFPCIHRGLTPFHKLLAQITLEVQISVQWLSFIIWKKNCFLFILLVYQSKICEQFCHSVSISFFFF